MPGDGPDKVAHAETPRPVSWASPGMSNHLAVAPVAMMTASEVYSSPPTFRWKGLVPKSTEVTSTRWNRTVGSFLKMARSGRATSGVDSIAVASWYSSGWN